LLGLRPYMARYPERFIEVGIAEQNPAILILALPGICDCSWRPTSLKVGLPLAIRRPRCLGP
jgi:transketolase C-terminal domain/subunit